MHLVLDMKYLASTAIASTNANADNAYQIYGESLYIASGKECEHRTHSGYPRYC